MLPRYFVWSSLRWLPLPADDRADAKIDDPDSSGQGPQRDRHERLHGQVQRLFIVRFRRRNVRTIQLIEHGKESVVRHTVSMRRIGQW